MKARPMLFHILIVCAFACLFLQVVATARGQTIQSALGKTILDADAIGRFELGGRQVELARSQIVGVEGQSFNQAIRVTTTAGANSEWNVQLQGAPSGSIQEGDVVLARFWMRCVESMTGEGFAGFVYEIAKPEFDKAAEVRLGATAEWRECFVPFRAPRDFPAGESRVCFRVGYDRQTIEIGGMDITNFGPGAKLEDMPRTRADYAGRSADAAWRAQAAARIEKHRKGDLTVLVTDASGRPVSGAKVSVKLKRHAFGFGSCIDMNVLLGESSDSQKYREIVEKYYNLAVFENDMKWPAVYGGVPPKLDQAVDWMTQRQIQIRGHNLFWPSWRWLPKELKQYENDPAALRRISEKHATDLVAHFKGKLIHWDVVNEPYTNHDLIDLLGGREVMIDWFKLAHQADPACKLYLNDYGILEGGPEGAHARHFYDTIKFLKESGAPIHGIGIQSHFSAALPSPMQVLKTLDHFSELGLPIELTEISFNIDQRDLQADYMRDFMTAIFSHPNVHSAMLWGFWENRHWRPQAALYAADWTIRPHGRAWIDLVHQQWRTDEQATSDANGAAKVRGFLGEYEIFVTVGEKSKTVNAKLGRDGTQVIVAVD